MMKPSHKEVHFFRMFSFTDTCPDVPKIPALYVSCFVEYAWDLSATDGCTENQSLDPVLDSASYMWTAQRASFLSLSC